MTKRQEKINRAVQTMEAYGYKLPETLASQVQDLSNPNYRVAVVGKFQVGKSTLLNRVFLGDSPILTEGEGLCTTAVATDITFGSVRKLSTYHIVNDGTQAEQLVSSQENPTMNDLRNATVANDHNSRAELAKKISRVVIEEPNEALKNYTIIDTPGLDDPEEDLLFNTTFRVIPKSDVALVIVEAKMLDTLVLDFLRNQLLGKSGLSRIMMLVSYRPKQDQDSDEEQRKDILNTIKAQLASIGREDIQVEMYCFDSSINDILSNASEIALTIRSFLDENALPGREEKVTNLIRVELEKIQVELAAKIKAIGASAEEKTRLQAKVNLEVEQFKAKCESNFLKLQGEVKNLRDDVVNTVDLAVNECFDGFYRTLEKCESIREIQEVLDDSKTTIKSGLSKQIPVIGLKVQEDLKLIISKYENDLSIAYCGWNQFLSQDFGVERPMLAKLPPFVWDIVNGVALKFALKYVAPRFERIATFIANLIGGKSIAGLVKMQILASVRKGLNESKDEARQRIMDMISDNIEKAIGEIKNAIEASNNEQVKAIQSGIETTLVDDADKAKVEGAKADIDAVLATF